MNKIKTILICCIVLLLILGAMNIITHNNKVERPLIGDMKIDLEKDLWLVGGTHTYVEDSNYINIIKAFDLNNDSDKESFNNIKSMCTTPRGEYKDINYYHIYHTQELTNYPGWYAFKDLKVENHDLYISYLEKDGYGVVAISDVATESSELLSRIH